jgi:hypothetical protein
MTNEASTISLATSSQLISYGQVGDHGLEGHNPGAHVKNFVLRLARRQQPEYTIRSPGHKLGLLFVVNVAKVAVDEVSGTRVIVNTDPGLEDAGISLPAQVSRFVGDLVLLVALEQVVPGVRGSTVLKPWFIEMMNGYLWTHLRDGWGGDCHTVVGRDTPCRRPLTRNRALGASGGGTRSSLVRARGTGRARTTWWTEESGRARAVVERDATVGGVEVARTGDAGAGEDGRFPRGGRIEARATPRCA